MGGLGMDFVSIVNSGSRKPLASQTIRWLRAGDLDPLLRLEGLCRGDGVWTAVEGAVVSPVADGVELATESLLFSPCPADELRSEMTSIMTATRSPVAQLVFQQFLSISDVGRLPFAKSMGDPVPLFSGPDEDSG